MIATIIKIENKTYILPADIYINCPFDLCEAMRSAGFTNTRVGCYNNYEDCLIIIDKE